MKAGFELWEAMQNAWLEAGREALWATQAYSNSLRSSDFKSDDLIPAGLKLWDSLTSAYGRALLAPVQFADQQMRGGGAVPCIAMQTTGQVHGPVRVPLPFLKQEALAYVQATPFIDVKSGAPIPHPERILVTPIEGEQAVHVELVGQPDSDLAVGLYMGALALQDRVLAVIYLRRT